ncbi:MAG: CBS domain-containing protein [Nanoarchaeota archaeon]
MKPELDYKVAEFMNRDLVQVRPDTSVKRCAEVMAAERVSSALVTEKKKVLGIVTEKDLARKIVAKGLDAEEIMAKDIMSTDVVTVSSNTSLYDAMVLINKRKIKHLPVVDNNVVVGIITAMEILRIQPSYMEILANPTEKEEEGSEF